MSDLQVLTYVRSDEHALWHVQADVSEANALRCYRKTILLQQAVFRLAHLEVVQQAAIDRKIFDRCQSYS